jgi:hypothetical protein
MSARPASPTAPTAISQDAVPGSFFLRRLRKLLIVASIAIVLGRVLVLNVGVSLEKLGVHDFASPWIKPVPSLDALLLRQQWSLFTDISPFNYTTHFEVILDDGSTVPLSDSAQQNATGWKSVLFYSEPKIQNNLYASPDGQRRYLEYLIRKNRIDPSQINEGVIFIRYQNLLNQAEAAATGTHYGPEIRYDLLRF